MGRFYEFKVGKSINKEFSEITKVICKKDCINTSVDIYSNSPATTKMGITVFGLISRLDLINILKLYFNKVKFIRAYTTEYNFNKTRVIRKQ